MNKNVLKIGALALGMFAFAISLNGTNAQTTGEVSLTITTGTSECIYGTSLDLGSQAVQLDTAYTFNASFGSSWSCTDLIGGDRTWTFTIQSSDLTAGGSTIAAANVELQHPEATILGDTSCNAGSAQLYTAIDTAYTIMERVIGSDGVCEVTISDVDLQVNVPANQAPGAYVGTLTLTLPTF